MTHETLADMTGEDVVKADPYTAPENSVYAALETYSNVYRCKGYYSMVTTHLFEKARDIIIDYLGLTKGKYRLIFCSPEMLRLSKL